MTVRSRELWIAATVYAGLTMVLAYPLSVRAGSVLFGDNPDTHLFMWTLAWDVHALLKQPLALFDANMYHPNPLTLAYSENLLGLAIMVAPVLWLTGNPVLAVNVAALLSCVLCGVGAYALARKLGLSRTAATICGLVFAFSPPRFVRNGQLHVGAVQWIPFTMAYLHSYFESARPRDVRLALAFFSLQAITSGHGAVYLVLTVLAYLIFRFALGEPWRVLQRLRDVGVTGFLLLAPTFLIYLPYAQVRDQMGFKRRFESWDPTATSFLAAPVHLQASLMAWFGVYPNQAPSAYLFPGYLPLLLSACALLAWSWDRGPFHLSDPRAPAATSSAGRGLSSLAVFLELLTVGAVLLGVTVAVDGPIRWKIGDTTILRTHDAWRPFTVAAIAMAARLWLTRHVPLAAGERLRRSAHAVASLRHSAITFYTVMTLFWLGLLLPPAFGLWPSLYWLPGLNQIRAPGRFAVMVVLGLAVLSAIGFDRLTARLRPRTRRITGCIAGCWLVIEFAGMPIPVAPFNPQLAAVDRWIGMQDGTFAIAEFPVGPSARYHSLYLLHSTAHWQKTVHGYSGYEAPWHTQLYEDLRGFPDDLSLQRLHEYGVRFAVMHTDDYDAEEWRSVQERLAHYSNRLVLAFESPTGRVYRVQ